jgi:transketolase
VVDHFTYALCRRHFMEGVNAEAASLAGHLGRGSSSTCTTPATSPRRSGFARFSGEDVCKLRAYYLAGAAVEDGNRRRTASTPPSARPNGTGAAVAVWIHTTIGFGSPTRGGTSEAHGSPRGPDEAS